jgi:hypothetical protein
MFLHGCPLGCAVATAAPGGRSVQYGTRDAYIDRGTAVVEAHPANSVTVALGAGALRESPGFGPMACRIHDQYADRSSRLQPIAAPSRAGARLAAVLFHGAAAAPVTRQEPTRGDRSMLSKNTWYVARTPDDIDGKPLGRKVCNEASWRWTMSSRKSVVSLAWRGTTRKCQRSTIS